VAKVARWPVMKRDAEAERFIPYARHIDESIIQLDDGEMLAVLKLEGMAFETADVRELNDWHEKLNGIWRAIADERVALYVHTIRRAEYGYPHGSFRSAFAQQLDDAYRARVQAKRMFVNEHYLTLVMRPAVGRTDKVVSSLLALLRKGTPREEEAEDQALEKMHDLIRDTEKLLGRLRPRLLGTYDHNGLVFSEIMEFMSAVMTGTRRRIPLVRGHLGSALYSDRLIFGSETIEIREPGLSRYAGMLGIREHAARTRSGQLDALLSVQFEFALGQSFAFFGKTSGMEVARRKQAQMSATDDVAFSQADELGDAMDDLQSNRFVLGEHQLGLAVFGDTVKALNENMSLARAALSESGMVAVREDIANEAAYWSQLPGNFKWRPRPAAITSRNFAALAPFHSSPVGQASGNLWGEAIALLKTSAHSPYFFNFHNGDLGHTLIIGPSGGGKTVIQNFLLAQSEKSGARQVFIDKDCGAEIYVRASGGTYLALKNGTPTGFAPLKALDHSPRNLDFLTSFLRLLVTPANEVLSAQDNNAIVGALRGIGRLPLAERSLGRVRSLLPQATLEGIGPRLERWCLGSELGWVFDNERDTLSLDADFTGFDMTDFLDNAEVRPPLMRYLFHRIDDVIDGRPVIIDIDEFWKALGDDAFRDFAQDGLKTYRKRNAVMMFGTQSPSDALKSDIARTIVEQVATKILLPNPNATERDYIDGLNLTRAEFALIRTELSPESRRFLVKQGHDSVVVELDLDGLDDIMAVLSGRSSTVALLDTIRGELGDDPAVWLPEFYRRRRFIGRQAA
jgi:type IV secretion system protein VirB4